jgi:hypothetical protein
MAAELMWVPEAHQLPILQDKSRFKVLVMHRKAHKTTMAINELLRWASTVKGTYWYVAPYYTQAKKIVWEDPEMLPKWCPQDVWDKRNNQEMKLFFPNGSILYVLGADKPDSLRGPNPRGVILDEYGDMKNEVWSGIIQPIMTANQKAWTWFVGTPKGRNDFYAKYLYAMNGKEGWMSTLLKATESGIINHDALEEARTTTTRAFFDQEYECEFLEDAGQFFKGVRNILYNPTDVDMYSPRGNFSLGIDLAKYNDWTVITPFNLNTFTAYPQERFNQIDWNLQKARIQSSYFKYSRASIRIDSTGLGDPIVDDLRHAGVFIDDEFSVKFSETVRRQLLDNLAIKIEQQSIKIPDDQGLIDELESFRFELTESGRVKVAVPESLHDDRVFSLALAVWKCDHPIEYKDSGEVEYKLYNSSFK